MITSYIVNFGHTYLVHACGWVTYCGFMGLKSGEDMNVRNMLCYSAFFAFFSAIAHTHFMAFLR